MWREHFIILYPAQFSDGERSVILAYKQKAIEKEQELICRRRDRVKQLRSLVQQKIANAEVLNWAYVLRTYFKPLFS